MRPRSGNAGRAAAGVVHDAASQATCLERRVCLVGLVEGEHVVDSSRRAGQLQPAPVHPQASMIRRYIAWRNRHVTDPRLRKVIKRAETIKRAKVA